VSLVARLLEANGISTVILGSAWDIVEYCGAPRFLFTDFPLGNPCGIPYDVVSQQRTLELALGLLESATKAGTILANPIVWPGGDSWKANYMRVDDSNRDQLRKEGDARRIGQAAVRLRRKNRT
jgi:D-proline reductase (dithiol) PrdB